MKKNIFNVLVVLLALCCLFVGCDNPSNNGEKNEWEPTNVTEPPVWADNTSDDNSNDDLENEDENNQSGGNNNNNGEPDSPSEDDESEITLPTGYEWWCFEKAYLDNGNYVSIYNYYEGDTCTRTGIPSKELTNDSKNSFYLSIPKESAISNYTGKCYQVTNLSTLPSWCY